MVMRLSSCISSFVLWRWHVDNLQRHDNKKDRKAKDWIIKMIKLQELLDQQEKEKSKYKVAICVTSYNQINYIEKALTSLLHQKTDFPYLIVVGDDCSTDGSCELLKSIQKDNSDRVKILFQSKNAGLFQNRKSIFLQCDAPYIAFCDGDDYWIDDTVLQKRWIFWRHIKNILDIRRHVSLSKVEKFQRQLIWENVVVLWISLKKKL